MSSDETMTSTGIELERKSGHSRLRDAWIHGREAILNGLSGARTSMVINQTVAEVEIPAAEDLAPRLKQTLDELKASAMDESGA